MEIFFGKKRFKYCIALRGTVGIAGTVGERLEGT